MTIIVLLSIMKYNNYETGNCLTSYCWFEGKKKSHFTVNKSILTDIHSTILFLPLNGKTESFIPTSIELTTLLFAFMLQAS